MSFPLNLPKSMFFGDKKLPLGGKTHIMGILNVTPDSFSDGGCFFEKERAIDHALKMVEQGAVLIDIGGESTRPGAETVSVNEELKRVIPVIEALAQKSDVILSIDTRKSEVALEAVLAGARLINDVSGFVFDPGIVQIAVEHQVPIVLMHSQGTPKTMQTNPVYSDVIQTITDFFFQQIEFARRCGLPAECIILDPGIGFGKTVQHNYEIIGGLRRFDSIGCPMLMGVSRKSFIGRVLNVDENNRILGTAAAVTACILNGAHILRVHDVAAMQQVIRIADAINNPLHFDGILS